MEKAQILIQEINDRKDTIVIIKRQMKAARNQIIQLGRNSDAKSIAEISSLRSKILDLTRALDQEKNLLRIAKNSLKSLKQL